jgi:hypothetical protein
MGTRPLHDEFYKDLTKGICKMLSIPQGQPSEEIASLLLAITEMKEPNVRYQTNELMKEWIIEKLIDPTGMHDYQENLQFIHHRIEEVKNPL